MSSEAHARFFDVEAVVQRHSLQPSERTLTEDEVQAMRARERDDEELVTVANTQWYANFRKWLEDEREALLEHMTADGAPSQVELLTRLKKRLDGDLKAAQERLNVRS